MNIRKLMILLIPIVILSVLVSACQPKTETGADIDIAVAVALTQTAAASQTGAEQEPAAVGFISGQVHLQAPPTPAMVVYAVDPITGIWASVETEPADAAVPFTIEVPPGNYQVFAFSSESGAGVGYDSEDGWSLATVTVAAGQTVSDIPVRPPSQSECGSMFGLPNSPDGRFTGYGGATEECKAALLSAMDPGAEIQPLSPDQCLELHAAMEPALGLMVSSEQEPVVMSLTGQTGSACHLTGLGNGNNFESIFIPSEAVKSILIQNQFIENVQLPCLGHGGMGPAVDFSCFTRGDQVCEMLVYVEPSDMSLCSDTAPIGECLANIAPEQRIFTIELSCAQGFDFGGAYQEESLSKQVSIEFAPGDSDITKTDSLQPGELHDYVLYAVAGQKMTVSMDVGSPNGAIMQIGGLDGTSLAVDYQDGSVWEGVMPSSQSYYIDVVSTSDVPVDYTLYVSITPEDEAIIPGFGNISGGIGYPGDTVPPLHIFAYNLDDGTWHWIFAVENTSAYTMTGIPSGRYNIVAYTQSDLIGGYGSSGGLNIVVVNADENSTGIDIVQWFEPGTVSFPAEPIGW